ncbi:TIGR03087 family PEP-CTERM/XrtA system glycosyltransferase [Alteromonas aestuariivivens]|uniref:TIGR03087 family PEP-CTERM/XrtA system glycosyltransferase n=2 Tax=Alteromonas aestuariivivens TaxID=1938339 RepID=A0A3D8MEX9_9ALTE|nr:TIGR03087 family PEP-CTERM/XrtA system glycosyltransferase [Alteromonas aestuariivivens]
MLAGFRIYALRSESGGCLKICVLAQRVPYPPNKGEKLRSYHQIRRLVELGHQVEVYSLTESAQDQEDARALAQQLNVRVVTERLSARWKRYLWALLHNQPLSVGAFYTSAMQKHVARLLADSSVDVMLLTASSLGFYVFNATPNPNCAKVLLDFMDVDSDKWRQYAERANWPLTWVYQRESSGIRWLEQRANQSFAATFLIAQDEVSLFHSKVSHAKPVQVLGNGMAFDDFYPPEKAPDHTRPHFLFTGVMDYKPNVDAVVWFVQACWPSVKAALPGAVFTIAGMNPGNEVKALAQDPSIQVTGFVDDILPYFHNATVFVAPFRIARGVQNKVLQAAACGVPIVTTSMGAEGIGFAHSDCMTIVDDADGFAEACIKSCENRTQSLEMAQCALQQLTETYSWEQQLRPLEEALAEL